MSTGALVSLDEYLSTAYHPDREYVDGVLVERNVGTQLHGLLQTIVAAYLQQFRDTHRMRVFTETRLRTDAATRRYRIPDVMAVELPYQKGKVVVDVPSIVVEIKSPEDTFDDILNRSFDYERLKATNIIVMDPDNRRAWRFTDRDLRLLRGASLHLALKAGRQIAFPFGEMFAKLDEE